MKKFSEISKKSLYAGCLFMAFTLAAQGAAAGGLDKISDEELRVAVRANHVFDPGLRTLIKSKPEYLPRLMDCLYNLTASELRFKHLPYEETKVMKMSYRATIKLQGLNDLLGRLESAFTDSELDYPLPEEEGGNGDARIVALLSTLTAEQKERLLLHLAEGRFRFGIGKDLCLQAPTDILESLLAKYTGIERSFIEELLRYKDLLAEGLATPVPEVEYPVLLEALTALTVRADSPVPYHRSPPLMELDHKELTFLRTILFHPEWLGRIRESLRAMSHFEEVCVGVDDSWRLERANPLSYGYSDYFKFYFESRDKWAMIHRVQGKAKEIKALEDKIAELADTLSREPERAAEIGSEMAACQESITAKHHEINSEIDNAYYQTQTPLDLMVEKLRERLAFNEGYLETLRAHRALLAEANGSTSPS